MHSTVSSARLRSAPRRTALLAAIALTAGGFLALQGAQAASAHDELLGSTPAAGQVLDTTPDAIALTFSEDVIELGTTIELVNHHDEPVELGETVVDGPVVSATVPTDLSGEYQVRWHVVSADGHPIEGTFDFGVGPDATGVWDSQPPHDGTATGDDDATANAPVDDDQHSDDPSLAPISTQPDLGGWAVPVFIVGGLVIVGLVIAVIVLARRRPPGSGGEGSGDGSGTAAG